MGDDTAFRKLASCALVLSLALLHGGSCASLSNGGNGGGVGESTVGETVSSSKLVTGPTLGSLYRSTRDEYGHYGREQRCASCGGGGGYGGYADRDMRTYGGRQGGIYGYYSGRGSAYDDRNWYYRPEAYDDRYRGGDRYVNMMMGYDDRYMQQMSPMNRYDDRYYPSSMRGYYDNRGEQRMPGSGYYPERMGIYGYRGNGYDNLDPLYDQYLMSSRGGTSNYNNRDRYYGTSGGYGGYGAYDHKNFRPWDETYSRPSPPSASPSGGASGPPQHQYPSAPSSPSSSQHHYQHHQSSSSSGPSGTYSGSSGSSSGHYNGPDRPDAGPGRPCCSECCAPSSRYPSGPTGTGHGYHQTPSQHHQQNQYGGGDRPDSHGRPGSWNYLSGGSASGGQDYHQGASAAGGSSHSQPGQEYGGNRGSYSGQQPQQQPSQQHYQQHRPDAPGSGDRQQNTAYGSRPRPSGLGATSYLMDRETGDSATASELHSADSAHGEGGGPGSSSSSSSSNDNSSNQNNDGKPVVGENPLKSNES
ncbi:prisilkin-39 isoform X2 [Armigeres subalbatus]|uniref:prisilkin-39 isoform X2 n=1 Tax=Armigeres subalbatus TaxID=124917 RepID=UPI002ED63207